MPKRPTSTKSPLLDIFGDDNLARVEEALGPATAPVSLALRSAPARSGQWNALNRNAPAHRREPRPGVGEEAAPNGRAVESLPRPNTKAPLRNVGMKLRLPQSMKAEFQTFKAEFSAALGGVYIEDSNIGRPLIELLLADDRERILELAGEKRDTLRRPMNHDALAMAEFDAALAAIISEALKQRRRTRRAHD